MSGTLPPIRGFIENTLIDWEGKIACEVFLPTCNLRCPYCHAGHLITNSGELESIPVSAVTDCLDRHRGWIDGVVISGGEPTLHVGLRALIDVLRGHGAKIKLDTNGTRPDILAALFADRVIDAVSMDIKAPFDGRYQEASATQCDVEAVRRSAEMIMRSGLEYEFRTTVCPAFTRLDDLLDIAVALRGARKYVLQQFVRGICIDAAMNEVEPYTRETLREFAARLGPYFGLCVVRGDWAERRTEA